MYFSDIKESYVSSRGVPDTLQSDSMSSPGRGTVLPLPCQEEPEPTCGGGPVSAQAELEDQVDERPSEGVVRTPYVFDDDAPESPI